MLSGYNSEFLISMNVFMTTKYNISKEVISQQYYINLPIKAFFISDLHLSTGVSPNLFAIVTRAPLLIKSFKNEYI